MKRRKSEMSKGRGSDCKWGGTGRGREMGAWREGGSRQQGGF